MVRLFTGTIIQTEYISLPVLFETCVKVMQIYLKKDISQTVCIYFLYFVTGGYFLVQGVMKK